MAGDPLRGINVDAAGGAGKVLKMIAEKVCPFFLTCQMDLRLTFFGGGEEQIGAIANAYTYTIVKSRR